MRRRLVSTAFVAISALFALTPAAGAAETASVSPYQVGFGPFIGGGDISTGAEVRHTSGYALSIERTWPVGAGFALGPRFEVSNAFVNTKTKEDDITAISTYDNRIVAAGFSLSHPVGNSGTFAQGVYVTGVAGRGYSKLSVDESTENTYKQKLYGNISGNYYGSELGAWIPLRGNLGVNFAVLGNVYRAKQTESGCTAEGEELKDGLLLRSDGECNEEDAEVSSIAEMRTVAAKVGLSLGF